MWYQYKQVYNYHVRIAVIPAIYGGPQKMGSQLELRIEFHKHMISW